MTGKNLSVQPHSYTYCTLPNLYLCSETWWPQPQPQQSYKATKARNRDEVRRVNFTHNVMIMHVCSDWQASIAQRRFSRVTLSPPDTLLCGLLSPPLLEANRKKKRKNNNVLYIYNPDSRNVVTFFFYKIKTKRLSNHMSQ